MSLVHLYNFLFGNYPTGTLSGALMGKSISVPERELHSFLYCLPKDIQVRSFEGRHAVNSTWEVRISGQYEDTTFLTSPEFGERVVEVMNAHRMGGADLVIERMRFIKEVLTDWNNKFLKLDTVTGKFMLELPDFLGSGTLEFTSEEFREAVEAVKAK